MSALPLSQSLVYSPLGVVVLPYSEYLWNTPPIIDHCSDYHATSERILTKRGKLINAGRTISYALHSGVTKLNLIKFFTTYRNNYRLTCLNQNCDIPICFWAPVCRMNNDRQITASSRHNFHILPHFNSKTTGPIFIKFLHDVQALVPLLSCAYAWRYGSAFRFGKSEQRVNVANVSVVK